MEKIDRIRFFTDEAYTAVSKYYNKDTEWVQYGENGEIPLLENLLFALLLCKRKTVESLFQGVAHFEKIFFFRKDNHLFPKFLHEFPKEGDFYTNLKIGATFLETYQEFESLFPEVFKEAFSKVLLDFFSALKKREKDFSGASLSLFSALLFWGKDLGLHGVFRECPLAIDKAVFYEEKETEAFLALIYSKGNNPSKVAFFASFLPKIHLSFSAYTAPRKKIVHRGYEELGSFFSYFTSLHYDLEMSLGAIDGLNGLTGALFSAEDFFEKQEAVVKEEALYTLAIFKEGERKKENPDNPYFTPFYGQFVYKESGVKEKERMVSFGLYLFKAMHFSLKERGHKKWLFESVIEEDSSLKGMEEDNAAAFYFPYLKGITWEVENEKKNTLAPGQKIVFKLPDFSFSIKYLCEKGMGQVSFANRPSRLFLKGEERHFPFDIKMAFREIDPPFKRAFALELEIL